MTNKYKYFVANWKMFGDLKTINSINKVIKFSKSRKFNKAKILLYDPLHVGLLELFYLNIFLCVLFLKHHYIFCLL